MDIKQLDTMQQEIKISLSKPQDFDKAMKQCLELHSLLHFAEVSGTKMVTFEDELWDGITDDMLNTTLAQSNHHARIERVSRLKIEQVSRCIMSI